MSLREFLKIQVVEPPALAAPPPFEVPGFANNMQPQATENLCWAAAVVSVITTMGLGSESQCDLATKSIPGCAAQNCGKNACDATGFIDATLKSTLQALGVAGRSVRTETAIPKLPALQALLQGGTPVICEMENHAEVIYGFETNAPDLIIFNPRPHTGRFTMAYGSVQSIGARYHWIV